MTNPFAALDISDDQDNFVQVTAETQKVKRTHQQKKQFKLQQEAPKPAVSQPAQETAIFQRHKQNAKQIRNNRAPPTPLTKKLNEGHYLDRRSGTGREDRPRKQGGGRGNVGNVRDQLNRDKYEKEPKQNNQVTEQAKNAEGTVPVETQPKVEQPPKLTLEQYYKNKGIEINNVYEKKVVNRGEINAEWIKKEKLTIVQSKQEKKISQRNAQNVLKFKSAKVGLDENLHDLGFGQKPQKKHEEKRQQKPEYRGKGGKKDKVVINDDDFPTL